MHTQTKDPVKMKQEGNHLQAKVRGLKETKSANTLIMDFQAPEL
jgi:hypothetical protein